METRAIGITMTALALAALSIRVLARRQHRSALAV
jgi:hypothetical protein